MHVRFTADAEADLDAISDYLKPRSPQGLTRIITAIFTTIAQLETFPLLGRDGAVDGTFELSVPRTNYKIIYVHNDPYYIDIIRVLHGALRYPLEDE